MILSVRIPAREESALGMNAMKYGVSTNTEVIDREEGNPFLYVDIVGTPEKCIYTCQGIPGLNVMDKNVSGEILVEEKFQDNYIALMKAAR